MMITSIMRSMREIMSSHTMITRKSMTRIIMMTKLTLNVNVIFVGRGEPKAKPYPIDPAMVGVQYQIGSHL